jgi:hypothetical protein
VVDLDVGRTDESLELLAVFVDGASDCGTEDADYGRETDLPVPSAKVRPLVHLLVDVNGAEAKEDGDEGKDVQDEVQGDLLRSGVRIK